MRRAVYLAGVVMLAAGFATAAAFAATALTPDSVQRMSVEGLKAQLGNPDLVIVDVRTAHDWDESKTKIKGAVREDFHKASSWVNKYPKEKTIVFY